MEQNNELGSPKDNIAGTAVKSCNELNELFDVPQAELMARLSRLAYHYADPDLPSELKKLGVIFHEKIDGDAKGFIAYFDATGEAIVVFKGTSHDILKDIEIDINFLPQDCSVGSESVCHSGFVEALDTVYSTIKKHIWGPNIHITGHSLGAGLASIFTYRLSRDAKFRCSNLTTYTFASPFVGDAAFSNAVRNTGALTIIFDNDFVSNIPDVFGSLIVPENVIKLGNAPADQLLMKKQPSVNGVLDDFKDDIEQLFEDLTGDLPQDVIDNIEATHSIEIYVNALEKCNDY